MMEQHLIERVQEMAGVDLDDIDDEEYERLQMALLESMTAQEEVHAAAHMNPAVGRDNDDDLPEGMAAQFVRPAAAGNQIGNLANQFADWAQMLTAATNEEQKGEPDDMDEEEKK